VTVVMLGYVAMSVHLQNCSPSQTMTFSQFNKIDDREAAIRKLERISISNLENCLRLLKHNVAHDINFFRLSSKLIPLANHEELTDWKYMRALKEPLQDIAEYIEAHPMRVDFHPDHFVVLNTNNSKTLKMAVKTLAMHEALLKGMKIKPEHRCVLHVGGVYEDKEKALEKYIENWADLPRSLQRMVILENDDTSFNVEDTLYLCEKLDIPLVFDLHHHEANKGKQSWQENWERIIQTWKNSNLPIKMHISSPRSEKEYKAHADYIDSTRFLEFLQYIKGSVDEIHCMIEAKQKDDTLFRLVEEMEAKEGIRKLGQSSFLLL
jgi:UV DNA damage endonuclease